MPRVAVMTCTPVTGCFELIDQSQVRTTSTKFLQSERQLNEMKIVKPPAWRKAGERQTPTVALGDPDKGMIEELLRDLKELDETHELSEHEEAMNDDALLQELELEIAFPDRDERIELIAEMEGNESLAGCWGAPDVSAESISEVKEASSSETMIKIEGKCGLKVSHLTGRFERPNILIPIEVIQQHPELSRKRRLWVPHRKHGRRKQDRLQMGLLGLCWQTRRKHDRWKPDHTAMPPLPLQLRPDGTRRWCSRRKRSTLKSVNRYGDDACPSDDGAMYVKLHTPNT